MTDECTHDEWEIVPTECGLYRCTSCGTQGRRWREGGIRALRPKSQRALDTGQTVSRTAGRRPTLDEIERNLK